MSDNTATHTDIAIIGGGLVGLTTACALAHSGMRITVVEGRPLETVQSAQSDGRSSAIAYGSYRFLKDIGVWDTLEYKAEPILDIRVSDSDSRLFLHYDHRLVGDEPMGYMVENHDMLKALVAKLQTFPNVTVLSPVSWEDICYKPHATNITLNNGQTLSARLLMAADGRFSKIREHANIDITKHYYQQHGIVCTVEHDKPHHGIAQERFLPSGPFAILPLANPHQSSLVWTEKDHLAPTYMAMNDDDFNAQIYHRFGGYLGQVKTISKRFSYPLTLVLAKHYTKGRLLLIGDAAHGIHPLAGQGFNLGIRDCEKIVPLLTHQYQLGLDLGDTSILSGYEQQRHFDAMSLTAITHGLNHLFCSKLLPVKLARRAGMAALNKAPAIKKFFMEHAMGMKV
jgi:2-octaprenyl-6-methoxyphenol hydroxylase